MMQCACLQLRDVQRVQACAAGPLRRQADGRPGGSGRQTGRECAQRVGQR